MKCYFIAFFKITHEAYELLFYSMSWLNDFFHFENFKYVKKISLDYLIQLFL